MCSPTRLRNSTAAAASKMDAEHCSFAVQLGKDGFIQNIDAQNTNARSTPRARIATQLAMIVGAGVLSLRR